MYMTHIWLCWSSKLRYRIFIFFIGVSGLSVGTSRKVALRAAVYFVSTTLMSVTTGKRNIRLHESIIWLLSLLLCTFLRFQSRDLTWSIFFIAWCPFLVLFKCVTVINCHCPFHIMLFSIFYVCQLSWKVTLSLFLVIRSHRATMKPRDKKTCPLMIMLKFWLCI